MRGIKKPWALSADETIAELGSSEKGLNQTEVSKRKSFAKASALETKINTPIWKIFVRQFTSPLLLILIFASIISLVLHEATQSIIILSMIFLSGILAFIQEYRSEKSFSLLRKKLTHYANVFRGGKLKQIDARNLVLGDVVLIELGNIVPADLRLLEVEDLEIDESMITGESLPVAKTDEVLKATRPMPQDQINMAFLGTRVVQGSGKGIVVAIGKQTEMGKTAKLLSSEAVETNFQKGVHNFGNFLIKIALGLVIFVALFLGVVRGDWAEAILFALALAVGLSPELFPMIVTINLSRGAMLMSKKQVIVKRLIAIEDLGNMDILCTDKTGTLTVGKIRVRGSLDVHGAENTLPLAYAKHCLAMTKSGKAGNPVDQAIYESSLGGGTKFAKEKLLDVISFDFKRRRMSCAYETTNGNCTLITKGAVDEVLDICTGYREEGRTDIKVLGANDRKRIKDMAQDYQSKGYRLIAVAERAVSKKNSYAPRDEKDMELLGFIYMSDAPKQSAKEAIKTLADLNVRVVILTGDTDLVTKHIAKQLDYKISGLLTGAQIQKMTPSGLSSAVKKANVFAGITPEQKLNIIQAFKKNGHTVGFMGDGVNDSPALRAADVGISFEEAIDVAKEAASVILLQRNLCVLADGIREGRRTFANIQTYINTTISSNFGNMLSLAGAALLLPFVPLLPAQILLLNLLSDLPMIGISNDKVSDEEVSKPQTWNMPRITNIMYFFGSISSLADYAMFALLLFIAHAHIPTFRSAWFIESLLTEIIIIFLLRSKKTNFKNLPSKTLMLLAGATIAIAFFIVNSGIGADFEFVSINPTLLCYIVLIVIGYAGIVEMGKRVFYKYLDPVKV